MPGAVPVAQVTALIPTALIQRLLSNGSPPTALLPTPPAAASQGVEHGLPLRTPRGLRAARQLRRAAADGHARAAGNNVRNGRVSPSSSFLSFFLSFFLVFGCSGAFARAGASHSVSTLSSRGGQSLSSRSLARSLGMLSVRRAAADCTDGLTGALEWECRGVGVHGSAAGYLQLDTSNCTCTHTHTHTHTHTLMSKQL